MNRTTAYLAIAAALLLLAVVIGLPRTTTAPPAPTPPPTVVVVKQPPPPPIPGDKPGSLSLTGRLSHPYLVSGTSDVYATLEVSAVEVPGAKRAPVNLALVIDRSGSMAGEKIAQARRAALRLVDLLNDGDRLAIVHYGSDVRTLSGRQATEENKERMRRYIRGIGDEGGTNIGDGLAVGERQLSAALSDFKVNRLLLLSDGQPTVGITSSRGLARVVQNIRARGISVTALGVGADFNEDLMQRLADVGGGSYGFISNSSAMATLFEKDLNQAGTQVARAVDLRLTLPPGVELQQVFGRPTTQNGRLVTVSLPDFAAGQVEKLVVHLSATARGGRQATLDVASFKLDYRDLLASRDANASLALAAMVTDDTSLAMDKRDKGAYVDATRARAAVNYKKAAVALESGKVGEAKNALRANEVLFDDAQAVGGLAAVDEDRRQNQQYFGLTTSAPSATPEVQRNTVKQMKVQSLRSAGRGDSVY